MPRSKAIQDTDLLLLDALNDSIGLIVRPSDPPAFIHRCTSIIQREGYPLTLKVVKGKPEFIWIVKRPQASQTSQTSQAPNGA